jgi:hypothetical protein
VLGGNSLVAYRKWQQDVRSATLNQRGRRWSSPTIHGGAESPAGNSDRQL